MKLGDLEFTAEDFKEICFVGEIPKIMAVLTQEALCELANRILHEKLDKAEKVNGVEITAMGETWIRWDAGLTPPIKGRNPNNFPTATHTARLVCIAPIGAAAPLEPIEGKKK